MNRKKLRKLLDKLKVTSVPSERKKLLNKIYSVAETSHKYSLLDLPNIFINNKLKVI